MRKAYRSNNIIDQHTLDRSTLPPALAELYERCDSPPKLHLLDPYREDSKPALKYYTDPEYFFDLWKEEMLKTNANDKIKTTRVQPGGADKGSPIRKRKAKAANGVRQPAAPVQSNVVLSHCTARNQQANGDFMHFPSEYQVRFVQRFHVFSFTSFRLLNSCGTTPGMLTTIYHLLLECPYIQQAMLHRDHLRQYQNPRSLLLLLPRNSAVTLMA